MTLPRREIAPGVGLSMVATDKFKVNSLIMNIDFPLTKENATYTNLCAKVLKRGTKNYPNIKSLTIKLDELYASNMSATTTRSGEAMHFGIFSDFLVSRYTQGCDIIKEIAALFKEMLFCPLAENGAFNKDYVSSEKKNLSDAIDSLINNKAAYAKFRCTEEMCKGEAFAIFPFGDKEILEQITPESLYEFYQSAVRERRIEFLYTGEEAYFEKVYDSLSEIFSDFERNYKPENIECYVKAEAFGIREVYEDMSVNQGKLSIGMRTGITNKSPDAAALIVANEIFGGSPSSKLFMNVREKMSLCYYCSSGLDGVKGLMFVNAGIETENYEIAKKAIFDQLDAVKRGDFTNEEFESAIRSLVNTYKSISDSVTALEGWYMGRIMRDEDDTPESRIAEIEKITPEEVKAAAAKISPDVVFFLRGTLKEDEADE